MFGYLVVMMGCWLGFSYVVLETLTSPSEEVDLSELVVSVAVGFLLAIIWPISLIGVTVAILLRMIRP